MSPLNKSKGNKEELKRFLEIFGFDLVEEFGTELKKSMERTRVATIDRKFGTKKSNLNRLLSRKEKRR